MSRRSMTLEVGGVQAEVVVGYDPPLCEFFAQVWTDDDFPILSAEARDIETVRRVLGKWDVPDRVWRKVSGDEVRNDAETVSEEN